MAARSSIRRLPVETGQGAGIGGGRGVRGMDRRESSELRDIELQVRAEELQIMEQSQSVLAQIEDYNARLQHLLAHPAMRTEQDVIGRCQRQVAMASSKLHRMRGRREEVTSKLDEAEQLAGSVRSLGTSRDTTVCHALNGLANTKLLYAAGEQLKPEVGVAPVTFPHPLF
ncbi:uncharacterized protein MONBRDRAFT_10814 [Monosiga brevicollis MX1]|uniref:Uncharacterized protein n=1 Tax=Monosiga brevicollis TaxID=81824 RepID=A9V7B4_MONBE|nr:uncharacterized protein MONBRDRAFT_10814 [Monosiga brevicollis MX1]EDQ86487.1 predicted protein [Monosiga brevicollis MX1]|eukprot:XP_001748600.1 hypothetical protein [Monosiga brevicollis MX1]